MQMSFLPRILAVIAVSTLINVAFAAEKVLCVVTNDVDKEVGKMVYEMDEDSRMVKRLYKERWLNDKRIERVEMYAKDLLGDGVVLNKKDKYVTVRLYSHNFDESSGGVLFLDTLYNGVNGQRKEYTIEVRMDGGTDAVMTYNGQAFNRMHFVAKRAPIVGAIGIEKVVFSK